MMRVIIAKEWIQYRRDLRVIGLGLLIFALSTVSFMTGWTTLQAQRLQARQAQQEDREVFNSQGEKTPHAAAHFGRMAYKKMPPLAIFDPGSSPYLGQVIWLEAHSRDPAMFRPAEDAPDVRRLADFSMAGILTLLIPLLAFILGYGSFASERERGTLRLLVSSGIAFKQLFLGKLAALSAVLAVAIGSALLVSVFLALGSAGDVSSRDILLRGAGIAGGYLLYGLASCAMALWVSARTATAGAALMVLLSLWTAGVVVFPKMAASFAVMVYPTPRSDAFWADAAQTVRSSRPERGSEAWLQLQAAVVSDAMGREVSAEEMADLALNRPGLMFEIGERIGSRAYAQVYETLYETYAEQRQLRRLLSLFTPTIALQHLSRTLAGSDMSAHGHFADAAEVQRLAMVRKMNEEMMLKGAGQSFYYLADEDFWATVPEFSYTPPGADRALKVAFWDLLVLLGWSVGACCMAYRASCAQSII